MATILVDGNTSVVWVTTIADVDAPTATEISAGEEIQSYLTQDGLDLTADTNVVDVSVLNSISELADWGRSKVDCTLTMFRTDGDEAWTEFADRPYGYLVIRRGVVNTTAYAADDLVEVYPFRASTRFHVKPASNEAQMFTVKMALTGDYVTEGTVSA